MWKTSEVKMGRMVGNQSAIYTRKNVSGKKLIFPCIVDGRLVGMIYHPQEPAKIRQNS